MTERGPETSHLVMGTMSLRRIARLMNPWELLLGINFRDHNPEYRAIIATLEDRVDRALGFGSMPAFAPTDDVRDAVVKGFRNRIVRENTRAAILGAVGSPASPQLTGSLQKALGREAARVARRWRLGGLLRRDRGALQTGILVASYGGRRLKHEAAQRLRQLVDVPRSWLAQRRFWKEVARAQAGARDRAQPVLLITPVHTPHVGYALGKIVRQLQAQGLSVCCALVDGFNPAADPIRHGWEWLREVHAIPLPDLPVPCHDVLARWLLPDVPQRYHSRALPRFPALPGLVARFDRYAREFVFAANGVQRLVESIRPRSVLNMAPDKYVYSLAIGHYCITHNIPVHVYTPMVLYPGGMYEVRPMPSILVASRLDIPVAPAIQTERRYAVVGSPLFDADSLPGPLEAEPSRAGVQVTYLTKRDFPNLEVIRQIKDALDGLGRPFHVYIKPHPNDTRSDYQALASLLSPDEYTYLEADEIESIDTWIHRSDFVITGPSNAIWQAFRQRKPVIYLHLPTVGAEHYPDAYRRYAPGPFATVWHVSELGEALRQTLRQMEDAGGHVVDEEKYNLLLEDVFNGGRADAARCIVGLLAQVSERTDAGRLMEVSAK